MKIALITIHRVTNYGAILQAYATKLVLSKYGEVSTIDYQNRFLTRHMDYLRIEPSIHGLKMVVHDILNFPSRYKLITKFNSFMLSNLNLTKKMNKTDLINGEANYFDVYVCGSDQIWNPNIISRKKEIDPIFFLSFVGQNKKKISYASSLGNHNFTQQEKPIVKGLLADFDSISTREENGVEKLTSLGLEKSVHHVLDPTLLFNKQKWMDLCFVPTETETEKFILVYSVPRTELLKKAIKFFADKLGYKVISIDKVMIPLPYVDRHIKDAGPKEFITLFSKASFVITDSFHGTCFALNFEIPFVSIYIENKTNRQESLLGQLGVADRIAYNENDFALLETSQEFKEVRNRLDELRKASLNFLDNALD